MQIQQVSSSLYRIGKHSSSVIKGIKCALACLGICDDFMAEPFHRFRTIERVFAWEDKFRRLLLRFERLSPVHYAFKTLAYTMINLRHYC